MTKHDAERKVKILDFIAATLRARGYPPSVREIATAVGLASTSAVHHHLQILERDGYLERGAAQSRAIRLTPTAAIRLGLSSELVPQATTPDSLRRPDHRRDRRRRSDRGVSGRVGVDVGPGHARPQRRRLRPARPRRLDDRGAHRGRRLRPDPPADHRPQRRHRGRPGRGERGHPQALLQGEGQDPSPASQSRRTRPSSTTMSAFRAS